MESDNWTKYNLNFPIDLFDLDEISGVFDFIRY